MTTNQKHVEDEALALAPGARITGEALDEVAADIVQLYRRGMTIRQISKTLGRSYGWVQRVLAAAGVELRPRGGRHEPTQTGDKLDGQQLREYRERLEVLNTKRRR